MGKKKKVKGNFSIYFVYNFSPIGIRLGKNRRPTKKFAEFSSTHEIHQKVSFKSFKNPLTNFLKCCWRKPLFY